MKYLIMCEGPNEFEIIRMLLEHDTLIFTEDDLLNHQEYLPSRSAKKISFIIGYGITTVQPFIESIMENEWSC